MTVATIVVDGIGRDGIGRDGVTMELQTTDRILTVPFETPCGWLVRTVGVNIRHIPTYRRLIRLLRQNHVDYYYKIESASVMLLLGRSAAPILMLDVQGSPRLNVQDDEIQNLIFYVFPVYNLARVEGFTEGRWTPVYNEPI